MISIRKINKLKNRESRIVSDQWKLGRFIFESSLINQKYGFPFLNRHDIELEPRTEYNVRIKYLKRKCEQRIVPRICSPEGKGKIYLNYRLIDRKGRLTENTPAKRFAAEISLQREEITVKFCSSTGIMSIAYECDSQNDNDAYDRICSDSCNWKYAMTAKQIDPFTVEYSCKNPDSMDFDCFRFSVSWEKKENGPIK